MAKKNLRKIPSAVRTQLKRLNVRHVVAGCSIAYGAKELSAGTLKHLGVVLSSSGLRLPASIMPLAKRGKYSDRNVNGYEVVRRDLPKRTHYREVETPNWGDYSHGSHTVDLPYQKYPRDFYAPHLASIRIETLSSKRSQGRYILVFEVDRVLDARSLSFKSDLLECLNLLQENVGACGIQKSGATLRDYLQTIRVSWEVLPPGSLEEAIARLFRKRKPSAEEKSTVEDRYKFLMGLRPKSLVYGLSGMQRYFGALIRNDLVVFENIQYGNAIYVMFEDWKVLSKRTRTELLSGRFGKNFQRVVHTSGWKKAVRKVIHERAH